MTPAQSEADLLVAGGTVLTMDAADSVLEDGAVAVTGGVIDAVGPRGDLAGAVAATREVDARGGIIMPGLINAHTHVMPILLRGGAAGDRGLYDWLVNVLYPGLALLTPDDARVASLLYASEATRAGVTTIVENADAGREDRIAEATLETLAAAGLRVIYARLFYDALPEGFAASMLAIRSPSNPWRPDQLLEGTDNALAHIESLIGRWNGTREGRIRVWPAPAMPQTTSEAGLRGSLELAERHDGRFTIHVAQAESDGWQGSRRVIDVMDRAGILGPRLLAAHCVWLSGAEIELLARSGVAVAHNPVSNLYLGAGIAPVSDMLGAGVRVCLGTDDANSNDVVNLLSEMRFAALLQRLKRKRANALSARRVLAMATRDGAACLGLEREIGSIEPGKRGDLIVVARDQPQLAPLHDPFHGLVFQTLGSEVDTTIVNGEVLMEHGRLTVSSLGDRDAIRAAAQTASVRLISEGLR